MPSWTALTDWRECPFEGCLQTIPAADFSCARHAAALDECQRAALDVAYTAYMHDDLSLEELRRVQEGIKAEIC